MAGRAMQCSIVMGDCRIVIRADRVAGTEAFPFQGGLQEPNESCGNSHKPSDLLQLARRAGVRPFRDL
jgi:hypothetical protein